jgi:hypothetical protein
MGGMAFIGLRFFARYKSKENNTAIWSYILCLPSMGWAVALLGNMEGNIIFTSTIAQASYASLALALVALGLGCIWLKKNIYLNPTAPLISLLICTLVISLLSAGTMAYMLKTFG